MVGFLFGGDTGISGPEELARRREIAEALLLKGKTRSPQNVGEGLQAIGLALRGRIDMNRLAKQETEARNAATSQFNDLFAAPNVAEPASYTEAAPAPAMGYGREDTPSSGRRSLADQPVKIDAGKSPLDKVKKALLDTIAGPESAGAYDVTYGGGKFADFSDHPRRAIPISTGPNRGLTSSAAGRYQMLAPTWDREKTKLGLKDFSPESQDTAAWDLASTDYRGKTGGDLYTTLANGGNKGLQQVAQALNGTWTSLPGGIEQSVGGDQFAQTFRKNMSLPAGGVSQIQPAGSVQIAQNGNGIDPSLMQALSNPWLSKGQQEVIGALVEQQIKHLYPDAHPMEVDGRIVDANTGRVIYEPDPNAPVGSSELGLNPQYGVDENGDPVIIQLGKNGKAVKTQLPEGVKFSKTPIKMDGGTHWIIMDPITRQVIETIPKDVAGAAAADEQGKLTGKAAGAAPAAAITAQQTIQKIDELLTDPELGNISGWQSYLPDSMLATTQGSHSLGLRRRVEQLKGTAFLEAYNGLRGGGQITEVEGKKAEDALGRLETAQNDADYIQALKDFRDAVVVGYQKLAAQAGGNAPDLTVPPVPTIPSGGASQPQPQSGNPALRSKYGLE